MHSRIGRRCANCHRLHLMASYVRQAVDKRNEKHFDNLTEDDRRYILSFIRALGSESSSLLARQFEEDAKKIAEATNFVLTSVKNAIYRVYSRVIAMAHLDWEQVYKLSKLAGIGSFVLAIVALFIAAA